MSILPFVVYHDTTKKTVDVDSVVTANNVQFTVDTSPVIINRNSRGSLLLHLRFSNFVPNPSSGSPGWRIQAIVEAKGQDSPEWFIPVGRMFEPLTHQRLDLDHRIIVQPNISNVDEGVPMDLIDLESRLTRVSKQQGFLGADFRVLLNVLDVQQPNQNALRAFDVEIFGGTYSHVDSNA